MREQAELEGLPGPRALEETAGLSEAMPLTVQTAGHQRLAHLTAAAAAADRGTQCQGLLALVGQSASSGPELTVNFHQHEQQTSEDIHVLQPGKEPNF